MKTTKRIGNIVDLKLDKSKIELLLNSRIVDINVGDFISIDTGDGRGADGYYLGGDRGFLKIIKTTPSSEYVSFIPVNSIKEVQKLESVSDLLKDVNNTGE